MEKSHQEMIVQTFVAAEILNKHVNAEWDKEDWEAMSHVADINLRIVIDMVKDKVIHPVILREHLSNYPQQISALMAAQLNKENISTVPDGKEVTAFDKKLTIIAGESFVGALLVKGIVQNKETLMDTDHWKILDDAREAFQHVVLGCIASRYIDIATLPTRNLLQFMEAVMSSQVLSADDDLEAAINEAMHSTKH